MSSDLRRPTSPHLQIYRLPLTALLSITHRGTGLVLTIGALLLVWVLVSLAGGPETYAPVQALLRSWFGQCVLFALTFALYFHFANGIRHLFWDAGFGFDLKTSDRTARLVIIIAIVFTMATWVVAKEIV